MPNQMGILEQLKELVDDASWFVVKEPSIKPVDIPFDYHVASAISTRMLHSRGAGIGHRRGTVYHAIADREIKLSRTTRHQGQALCGAKLDDLSSSHEAVSCPDCDRVVKNLNLQRSIKNQVGAWL